ncbi:hypothetical protein [Kitasatospora sp. LaBMicrA B282]|uniref:hypothetical protein n=1 Tax=Kitasatospora sp. LaBMicrA B282 TaxID=3420949 RepID=UPI003D0E0BDD
MRVAEARELIGEAVVASVRAGFAAWYREMNYAQHPAGPPAFQAVRDPAGHDASQVPDVAKAEVESQLTEGMPHMFFTYKREYGGPPIVQLWLHPSWARKVARPGWAVMDGRAVLDVLAWEPAGGVEGGQRPVRVRAAVVQADYDSGMHGWRAHADNLDLAVAWSEGGKPQLLFPWQEGRADGPQATPVA